MDWISVLDRLPDGEEIVLLYMPNASEPVWLGYLTSAGEWLDSEVWRLADGSVCGIVTHWMPLPAGPA